MLLNLVPSREGSLYCRKCVISVPPRVMFVSAFFSFIIIWFSTYVLCVAPFHTSPITSHGDHVQLIW